MRADYDGYLYEQNFGAHDGDEDYVGMFKSKWYDMGDPSLTKRLYRTTFLLDRHDNVDVTVKIRTDWRESCTPDISTTITTTGTGVHYLDTETIRKKIDYIMSFHSLQVEIRTDSKDEPWGLQGIIFEWRPIGTTPIDRS